MQGYDDDDDDDRDELQDYDDYYDEGEGAEEYEEEEEEEKPRKPTKEELEYLELRQKLKDSIRKQMKREGTGTGSSASRTDSTDHRKSNKLPYDNYGSFFGPAQPVIAQRVIQESKSLLENQHLAPRVSNPNHIKKNPNKVSNRGSKPISKNPPRPSKHTETMVNAQKLKNTRDYSFLLSDDAELPAPSKATQPQKVSVRNSEGRPAQVPGRSKQPLSELRPGSMTSHLPPKPGPNNKLSSSSKPSTSSEHSRRQLGNNSANGPGRPVGPKVPSKMSVGTTNGFRKPLPPKATHSSIPGHSVEPRKDAREPNKLKMIPKQSVASSKPQNNKPVKQNPIASQDHRPKKKVATRHPDDVEDDMDISRMIRSMFNYNPNKFADQDDDDNMEAGFDEILKEERRSSLIAKQEDDEQLKLIEEEEERERRRRLAKLKKRKLGE
ncbi:uncharacterized protein LOC107495419 isoform X1 [Arachis duranensis]|uniref:Uncharacterized protein LOC107495419 isoform X1 n=1 Tax=Arachis duranensis TaxID=130453 RepID=A0A9C6WR88_ARADU|nr:uncharacterized protein LOC107495419 isoform X1 [Arachis duranensis]